MPKANGARGERATGSPQSHARKEMAADGEDEEGAMTFGSLFAGIGGFDLGLERTGMQCLWQVENDANCIKVLWRHWPDVEQFGDVTDCGRANLEAVDLICGGFPCQDVSVAGRRSGLAGERSGLWWEFHRIIGELSPKWVLIENVPGLLSSNGGRDMGAVVGSLAELGYWWAYRVLDAQYDGLAQRRKRVFIVGCFGERGAAAKVLFEPESVSWDSAPGREAGTGVAEGVAASLRTGADGGRPSSRGEHIVAASLTQGAESSGKGGYAGRRREDDVNLVAFDWQSGGDVRHNVSSERVSAIHSSQTKAVATLNSGGGSGGFRSEPGEHLVVGPLMANAATERKHGDGGISALDQYLSGHIQVCAVKHDKEPKAAVDRTPALQGADGGSGVISVSCPIETDDLLGKQTTFGIRRLTPRECERLQGFPDDFTARGIDDSGKEVEMSDSARYRMLGNAVAVPVAEWIAERIGQ
jgi:DNA (cytosine-5)-methyltransferase 1